MDKLSMRELFDQAVSEFDKSKNRNKCGGLFFRCKKNTFINSRGEYVEDMRMSPLKRMSCKGCPTCDFLKDDLSEFLGMGTPIIIDNPEHGAVYELRVVNEWIPYESSYAEDWDLEFIKVNEGEDNG